VLMMGPSVIEAATDGDEALSRACRGDAAAFRLLYDRYADLVYSVALLVLADESAAEDVAQEVFLRFWRKLASFDPQRGQFASWLMRVTRNRAVDEVRARGRLRTHQRALDEAVDDLIDEHAVDPALMAVLEGEREQVRLAMAALPDEQREVLVLAYFSGLTQEEIAIKTGAPLGTVKTRIRLAVSKLRSHLSTEIERKRA